jgi:hypothetical protein
MRNKIILALLITGTILSCDEESKPVDPIYEFIAFKGPSTVNVNEFANSEEALPLVVELKAFKPYPDDIAVTLEVVGNNAEPNVDFTITPAQSITIPAGSLLSDTIYIRTIDNNAGSPSMRSFDLRIKSVSKGDINIGLGLTEPKNSVVTVNILDDECSETTSIFNGGLVNTLNWGEGDVVKPATGTLTGSTIKVTGDLIGYGAFPNASMTITLTPQSEGATKGTATFGEQVAGTDNDGWEYKFIQAGAGTYDVCNGTIAVDYDIYYMDGGSWVYWYTVKNIFSPE